MPPYSVDELRRIIVPIAQEHGVSGSCYQRGMAVYCLKEQHTAMYAFLNNTSLQIIMEPADGTLQ